MRIENNMKFYFSLVLSLIASSLFLTQVEAAEENILMKIEKSRPSNDIKDPEIASIGALSLNDGKIGNFDLINFKSDIEGEVWGFDIGLGYPFSSRGSPLVMYAGFGILLGRNTGQGDYLFGYYPSVGLIYSLKQGVGITVTAKRYFNIYDDATDAVMLGIALKY